VTTFRMKMIRISMCRGS